MHVQLYYYNLYNNCTLGTVTTITSIFAASIIRADYSNNPQAQVSLADTSLSFHLHVGHESGAQGLYIPRMNLADRHTTRFGSFVSVCTRKRRHLEHFVESIDRVGGSLQCVRTYVQTHSGTRSFIRYKSRVDRTAWLRIERNNSLEEIATRTFRVYLYICGFEFVYVSLSERGMIWRREEWEEKLCNCYWILCVS